MHCLASLEGLDGGPEHVALIGRARGVERRDRDGVTFDGGRVRGPGVTASVDARDRFFWIRVPRVLSYYSATCAAKVNVDGEARDAFVLLEHAWGAETRLDVAALAPRVWQWDVLALGGDRFFAGLAIHGFGAHGASRQDRAGALARVGAVRIRSGARARGDAWSGVMHTRRGTLRYEARAATPAWPLAKVDGGAFVGFTWEGTLRGVRVSGAGFSERRH